ncbi:putative TetR-family transcriptional regulator [Actinoplanes missouriensis 431]|uniref:Putative TetR-family transcriptional regulator n=1 Tax=Actinoplanes missouriensis (strain ATCC 14538 / DSM 43046 / CBS 188.64 / JCM 3121 / NBRC 102363 / NCIMB 12654 / NRRL B-3342 / UNCC 431) TaxID=512565 RepID=I0H4J3_ACTM4|nr:TetR/AcrR family transcriptional regulator [Actinoplanes missouriensis]BAL87930.1 putative TetR-family transcriptional regulator [Actinoplanes missouriensis 431]
MTAEDRTAVDPPVRTPRRWSRTAQTRAAILAAARTVFLQQGYADANVSDVVELAGSSSGSIYHHFGGKPELYVALWEEHEQRLYDAARSAVQIARSRDESDPVRLFLAGARAYLEQSWLDHGMSRLFFADDSPPGFERLRRTRAQAWIRDNTQLLGASGEPAGRVLVSVLSSIVADGAWELSGVDSRTEAEAIIEATLGFIGKVAG